ncbi:MAG: hypothetical protein HY682_06600 [Chloroflexi bacterium]|nr:hypothetical protein [Chloroflexota bacterium]
MVSQLRESAQFLDQLLEMAPGERVNRLRDHLKSHAMEDPAVRAALIRGLMDAGGRLPPDRRKEYVKVRASVLAGLPMGTQMALLGTYREVLSELPRARAEQERGTLESALPELTGKVRVAAERFLSYLSDGTGVSRPQVEDRGSRRQWWKFWS